MSMLARYRKPGGMDQLVALLESCLPKKQETLLNTVMAEDAEFGTLVKDKMLTIPKIFSWDPLLVCEITTRMTERALATALKGLPENFYSIATHTMRDMKKRDLKNMYDGISPTPVEIQSAQIKLIETARACIKEGVIKLGSDDHPVSQAKVA